jgi:hypothetical protein
MPEPHLRAADSDRAAVATALGEHMAAGRLTVDEYDERLTRVYAAKTYGELAEITVDLPDLARRPATRPAPAAQPRPAGGPASCGPMSMHGAGERGLADGWRAWLTTSAIVTTIWLLTSLGSSELLYFWPMWVIGPWGAVLLASTLAARGSRRAGDGEDRRGLPG